MKRALSIGSLLAVVVAAGGCVPGGRSTAAEDHVRGQVVAFLQEWISAIAANDSEAIRPMYVCDAARFAWFEDGVLRYTSVGEIIEALRGFPPGTTIQTELSDIAVMPLSTRDAYASARFETRIDMATGPFSSDGVFTVLLELTDDGWVMVQGHTSRRRDGGRASPPSPR